MRTTGVAKGSVLHALRAAFLEVLPKGPMQVTITYKCICGELVQRHITATAGDNTFTTKCACGRAHNGSFVLEVE